MQNFSCFVCKLRKNWLMGLENVGNNTGNRYITAAEHKNI
jgi:hypothetical protein